MHPNSKMKYYLSYNSEAYAKMFFLSCYIIIVFVHASSAEKQGNETDKIALLAFKSGIKDDPFQALGSWNESIHFCEWLGVICSRRHQRVIILDLQHQKLQGSMTPYIGNLSFLHHLLLENNSFTGEIPTELGRLERLELLWLDNNSLSGEIPGNLSSCSNLREIILDQNSLVGKLPMQLGGLLKLQIITAGINNITGNIPSSFGNLSSLEIINFHSNSLTGSIPEELGRLSKLEIIDLGENRLSGEIPAQLDQLRRLEELWLDNNSLSGEIPGNLSSCSNLRKIILDQNSLVGKLPMQLGGLLKLQIITAGINNITGNIPPSFGNFSSLEIINFHSNRLTGSIPEELGRLSKLEFVHLSENRLSGIFPPAIFNLSSLREVYVGYNHLQGTIPSYIDATLPNLTHFGIGYNQFTGSIPAAISNMSSFVHLYFAGNQLFGKVPTFWNLYKLLRISLDDNLLGSGEAEDLSFISSLTNASNLDILSLGDNNFGGILPQSFSNLSTKLTWLYLANNQITGSIPGPLPKFVNMIRYNIRNNEFTGDIPASIGELSKLQELDLSLNRLSGRIPPSIGKLSMLNNLYLDGNRLSGEIPPSLGQCVNLVALNISSNILSGTIPLELLGLSSLVLFLDLSHNQLRGPLPPEVGNLKNLGKLYVSRNMLSGEIPSTLEKCMSLEGLYMDGNLFHGNIPSSLRSLRGLQFLGLSENNLSGQIPEFLGGFDLRYLNLSYNAFEGRVPEEGIFRNSSAVSIVGNPKLCGGVSALQLPRCSMNESEEFVSTFTFKLVISIVSVFLAISLLLVFLFLHRRRAKKVPSRQSSRRLLPMLSYHTLYQATEGFSLANLIGTGSYASVYRGVIESDAKVVAVKVFNLAQVGASRSWIAECEALRNIRHRNLLKVLTACSSLDWQGNEFKALIYEFMSNGSLEKWLHPNSIADPFHMKINKLSFLQRLNVAFDVARGVEYLHHHSHEPIVHCDLKPSNILLDEDLVAHVGDFGLARLLPAATQNEKSTSGVRGTIGYTAPEYGMASKVSTSGDVYSFGILLLEMFTGLRPTNNIFREGLNLHNYVRKALPERVTQIADPILLQEIKEESTSNISSRNNRFSEVSKIQEHCLMSVFQVGLACSAENDRERIDIRDAAVELNAIKKIFLGTLK